MKKVPDKTGEQKMEHSVFIYVDDKEYYVTRRTWTSPFGGVSEDWEVFSIGNQRKCKRGSPTFRRVIARTNEHIALKGLSPMPRESPKSSFFKMKK